MTLNGALYPRIVVHKPYVARGTGERVFILGVRIVSGLKSGV